MCSLSIKCLGSFAVKVDNEIITLEQWKSKKALTLLKYLAAKQGEKVSLDSIVEVLWPGSTVEMSTNNLYTTIYNLRTTLDPAKTRAHTWIRNSNGLYWLDLTKDCYLDIIEFERNIKLGKAMEMKDPAGALEIFLKAIKIYRGKFLLETEHEPWTNNLRDYYRRQYTELVLKTARLLVKCLQDYALAISLLRKALGKEPYREELYKQLILYLLETGCSLEALIEYQNYSQMLESNFGLTPSEEVRQLIYHTRQSSVSNTSKDKLNAGAFQCDPQTLKMIIELEQRRMERHQQPLTLLIINTGKSLSAKITKLALKVLRRGDVVCRHPDRLVVLLSVECVSSVDVVINRLESIFLSELKMTIPIKYQIIKDKQQINII